MQGVQQQAQQFRRRLFLRRQFVAKLGKILGSCQPINILPQAKKHLNGCCTVYRISVAPTVQGKLAIAKKGGGSGTPILQLLAASHKRTHQPVIRRQQSHQAIILPGGLLPYH